MLRRADFLTVNEKRRAVGYAPIDGGDVVVRPGSRIVTPVTPTAES